MQVLSLVGMKMEVLSIPPRKIKLMLMSKGKYQWEISSSGDMPFEDIIKDIKAADDSLKMLYGNGQEA
jgi:hypothetical protein